MACRQFRSEGIGVNVTLCFSPAQALLAAKAGASYISPFVGRLDDIATDGMELIAQIVQIYGNYDFQTEVLVASVRHPASRGAGRADGRRRRHRAGEGAAPADAPPADGQGARGVPGRLGEAAGGARRI
jgi:hypothetical protein